MANHGGDSKPAPPPIAAIGGSAAHLEPVLELVQNLPTDGLALVVVLHQLHGREADIAHKLRAAARLEVVIPDDGTPLAPGRLYLAPPTHDVAVFHGILHLLNPVAGARTPRLPIDYLFKSLAADRNSSAIGILLAGTASDGAYGLKAIKADGGLTFLQHHDGADGHGDGDGSPHHHFGHFADYRLPPAAIAAELAKLDEHDPHRRAAAGQIQRAYSREDLGKLFILLRNAFGTDFSYYKHTTIERRIERRMAVHRLEELGDYVKYAQAHPEEIEILYRDCLIGVTNFFRDHEPFEALKATVLPRILEHKRPGTPFRIWVPGCATGEEAYSLAMCLHEHLEGRSGETKIQVFASDLDDEAVEYARRGIYPRNIVADVSPRRLQRFFVSREGDYQVSRRIRDLVIFAHQDVTRDPPFSHVDLVSCRNVLIYFQPVLQKKVLRIFHYALNPDGVLMLGTSETIGDAADMFTLLDKQQRMYAKKNVPSPAVFDVSFGPSAPRPAEPPRHGAELRPVLNVQQLADRKVLELYGPPGVLVNENLDIVQFRGRVGALLEPAPGTASLNLLKLIRPELVVEMRAALQRALVEGVPMVVEPIRLRLGPDERTMRVEIVPLHEPDTHSRCLLVLFTDLDAATAADGDAEPRAGEPDGRARELERELSATKEYLQTTIEELESANEELKSSNEELQSSNEELQSTNEELETSKEELQSTNEELNTVNDELHGRMTELSQAHDDLTNINITTDEAIVIVGMDLRIRRFSGAAERLLNLVGNDVGRTIGHLTAFFGGIDLEARMLGAINRISESVERTQAQNGRWYRLRVSPYKTADHAIRGALLVVSEIDTRADHPGEVRKAALAIASHVPLPMLLVDRDLRVVGVNDAYHDAFKDKPGSTTGFLLGNLGTGQWAHPRLRDAIQTIFAKGASFRGFGIEHDFGDGKQRRVLLSGGPILVDGETIVALVFSEAP